MNIKPITKGIIGLTMLAGTASVTSCVFTDYEEKAKEKAVKYLTGDELLKTERILGEQSGSDERQAPATVYWDSLLTEAKVQEAYFQGQQLIRDSLVGKHRRKPRFKANLDTIIHSQNLYQELIEEYASKVSAEQFIKARNNQPKNYSEFSFVMDGNPNKIHYWNLITETYRIKEAFYKGMQDEREVNKNR